MHNGRIINAEIGLGYGIFSFIGCGIICLLLYKDKNKLKVEEMRKESFPNKRKL